MSDGPSIDLTTALPYLEQRILTLIDKDPASNEWKRSVERLTRLSAEQSSFVQCVGMPAPIPIAEIYQPTRLIRPEISGHEEEHVDFSQILHERSDAVIFAGPGRGKTTLLHWIYYKLALSSESVPILFTLRGPNACETLSAFVQMLERGRKATKSKRHRLILLVDGYDEVSEKKRKVVSEALLSFRSLKLGNFLLTCREYYDVYDLQALHCRLAPFSYRDSLGFIEAFSRLYRMSCSATSLLEELREHGFDDFAAHPLMLALVCVLKSGPDKEIPRRSIGLIRRAIDTLSFRWDQAKAVHRASKISLDGEERVRCLMRIAFYMPEPQAPWTIVSDALSAHLDLIHSNHIDKRQLVRELSQWYGILVPVDAHNWQFVHRTIHDYLAARFWVENGQFVGSRLKKFDMRAAYAACLLPDATGILCAMLRATSGLNAFNECLYNGAPFDESVISRAVLDRVKRLGDYAVTYEASQVKVKLKEGFAHYASYSFLQTLFQAATVARTDDGDAVAFSVMRDAVNRGIRMPREILAGRLREVYDKQAYYFVDISTEASSQKFRLSDVIQHT